MWDDKYVVEIGSGDAIYQHGVIMAGWDAGIIIAIW